MKNKVCKRCGKTYWGTGSSKYCIMCRDLVILENIKKAQKNA